MEEKREIKGFENYQIYSDGRVWSKKRNKFRKEVLDKDGYPILNISKNGKSYCFHIHRLVFETFNRSLLENEDIHHINHIRTDNRIENLEAINGKEHNRDHKLGQHDTQETRRKKSQHLKGKVWTAEELAKREQTKKQKRLLDPTYGKPSSELKKQLDDAKRGKPGPNKGKHLSQETKRKKSQAMRRYYEQHPQFNRGRKLSPQTIAKRTESRRLNKLKENNINETNII